MADLKVCPTCEGEKTCAECDGSGDCPHCKGEGKVSVTDAEREAAGQLTLGVDPNG